MAILSRTRRFLVALLAVSAAGLAAVRHAGAEPADLSKVPLANSPSNAMLPNLMYVLDGPERVEGLSGKAVFFFIVPLALVLKGRACRARAGHKSLKNENTAVETLVDIFLIYESIGPRYIFLRGEIAGRDNRERKGRMGVSKFRILQNLEELLNNNNIGTFPVKF